MPTADSTETTNIVSVPYQGFIILNAECFELVCGLFCVSVPYRGFFILNQTGDAEADADWDSFRPLSGLYYSKLEEYVDDMDEPDQSFRPLSGLYYSK